MKRMMLVLMVTALAIAQPLDAREPHPRGPHCEPNADRCGPWFPLVEYIRCLLYGKCPR